MKAFKIATWNVNSLRVRLPHLLTWINQNNPDVLALQETKICDEDFPTDTVQAAGYSVIFSGQKSYNGVAILSRNKKIENITTFIPGLGDLQRRFLAASIGDLRILNLYVPNGQHVTSEKYQYKLNWLKMLECFLLNEIKKYSKIIILGDFNIAPDEMDVHDPKLWHGQVLFTDLERQAFKQLLQIGFNDCFRNFSPNEKKFTWWDYRLNAFKRNIGLRIDHILASFDQHKMCVNCHIDTMPRQWERPSDHAPVIAEFSG